MARDFRVRATLTAIDEALLSLVREKPLAQITIKELCERAGIDRSTFYRHYHSVADVMESEEQRLLVELEGRLEAHHMTMEETLVMVLEAIKSDSERYTVLFSEHGDASFPGRVLGVAYKHAQGNLDELYPQLSPAKKRWIFDYVAYGLSAIWKDWIEGGMVEPVFEVAQFATLLVECGTGTTSMDVEQYVMAYGVEHDKLRAILPEGFTSLRPVLRINAEIHNGTTGSVEFNTAVEKDGFKGWLNIGHWTDVPFSKDEGTTRFQTDFLDIFFTPVGIEGSCPAEKDNDGCIFLDGDGVVRKPDIITAHKEFCDCEFTWTFTDDDARGKSSGETLPAIPTEIMTRYPKQAFTVENAAHIPCDQVLGTYTVTFKR